MNSIDGLVLPHLAERLVAVSQGSSSGGTGTTCSPGTCSGSRLVAITRTPGAVRRTSVDQLGGRVEQVLAVVEHEQQLLVPQVSDQDLARARPPPGL